MKTPAEIADEWVDTIQWPYSEIVPMHSTDLADMLIAAIEDDRAQRQLQPGDEHDTAPERLLFGDEQAAPGSDDA